MSQPPRTLELVRHEADLLRLRAEAVRIRKAFRAAKKFERSALHEIGERRTKRKPIPPFQRAEHVLAGEVYSLACKAHLKGHTTVLERYIRWRDAGYSHKPRESTIIDWAVRLIDGLYKAKETLGIPQKRRTLMSAYASSRLTTELNFAFRHRVKPELVGAFVHLVGGYEIISAMEAAGGYKLDSRWLQPFIDNRLLPDEEELPSRSLKGPPRRDGRLDDWGDDGWD